MSAKILAKLIFCTALVSLMTVSEAVPKAHDIEKRTTCTCSRDDILGTLTTTDAVPKNQDDVSPGNCKQIYTESGETAVSGLYKISPKAGEGEFTVFCDMDLQGGGWTVILRHVSDSLDFNRVWTEYRNGFGNLRGNFWLGLEKIRLLTDYTDTTFELYIGLENFYSTDSLRFAWYDSFSLATEVEGYKLSLGIYKNTLSTCGTTCDAGDSFSDHDNQKFSTPDNDNDATTTQHCGMYLKSGWWFKNCHKSHLTGKWYSAGLLADINIPDGIIWDEWMGNQYSLETAVMAIRPIST